MYKISKKHLVHIELTANVHQCRLQTYFIKANSNSVSDWYFRIMTKAEECRIEFHVEVFRINKNNHGLVEVERRRWMGRRKRNASISNIVITFFKLKSYPLNHNLIRNHTWTTQKHAYNSDTCIERYKLHTYLYIIDITYKHQIWC